MKRLYNFLFIVMLIASSYTSLSAASFKDDMKEFFGKLSLGDWSTIGVPLKCLKQNGLNLQKITVPMGLLSSGEWEFDIGKVYLEGGEGGKHIYPCN